MVTYSRKHRKSRRSSRKLRGGYSNPANPPPPPPPPAPAPAHDGVTVLTAAEIDSMLETIGKVTDKYDVFKQEVRNTLGGLDMAYMDPVRTYLNRDTDEYLQNNQLRLNLLAFNRRITDELIPSLNHMCQYILDIQNKVAQLQPYMLYQ